MLSKQEMRKPNIYIASPFFSFEQVDRVERLEEALRDNPFIGAVFSPRLMDYYPLIEGSDVWRTTVFSTNLSQLEASDVVIAIADYDGEDTDSGTAWEVGYAIAQGKQVLVVKETDVPLNLMIADSLHYFTDRAERIRDYNFIKMPECRYKGAVI